MLGKQLIQAAAGSAAAGAGLYVEDVFSTDLWPGTASAKTITTGIDLATEGGLVWIKNRTGGNPPTIRDTERGANKGLDTNSNSAEYTSNFAVTAFTSSGFTLGADATVNGSSFDFVGWSFRKALGFFDIVTYNGNATAGTSHSHNLSAVPEFIICKSYNTGTGGAGFWCYHKDLSTNYAIRLDGSSNGSVAEQSASNYWNSSTHSATTFTLGNYGDINGSGKTFISHLFSTLSGISKVGSYSGTGNAINVDCGFSSGARYILIKRKDASGNWFVYDSARGIVSGNDPYKLLNTNAAEVTNTDYIDPLNSGFTVTSSAPTGLNASGGTYIFLAIA